jgi:Mlc titration factor MtfA (ptsG expression regulator)
VIARAYPAIEAVLLVLAGAAAGLAFGGPAGAAAGALGGLLVALALAARRRRARARREEALARPFAAAWREVLHDRCDHYDRLPPALRARFEEEVQVFIAQKRITGIGVDVDDELRLLVAASAVSLSVAWDGYGWDQLAEVLLYPQDFGRDYSLDEQELAGQAHPWGTVILSVPALEDGFEDPEDGYNVGFHEFAHLLGATQAHFEGIPPGLDQDEARRWAAAAQSEMPRLHRSRSAIDSYGAEDPLEFLACAVEAFFENAQLVRHRHPEVYALLRASFRQDPAAWDDERLGHLER